MNQSHSRHNILSKVDHDRSFIDKNYRGPNNDSGKELPTLQMDIRKKLASFHLSAKLSGKTPVTTVASGYAEDENASKFFDQFGNKQGVLYNDDNASVASNHSLGLENLKKSPELIKMENFMDELGKVGHEHDNESEGSVDSDESFGDFALTDRQQFKSTLDAHKHFMEKARKKNSLSDVKTVAAVKIMTHKKKLAQLAQNTDLFRPSTANTDMTAASPDKKSASGLIPSAPASTLGLGSAAKSFMFLSKLTGGSSASKQAGSTTPSPFTSPNGSPLMNRKSTSSEIGSPPIGSPAQESAPLYTASPGGYAYSSKHNLLHDPSMVGSGPNSPLPLFGKVNRPKQIAHRTFTATTLSTLNSKYDTTHSVLSATRDHGAVVKVAHKAPSLDKETDEKNRPLYHVPELKAVHGKKTLLDSLDRMFNSFTFQAAAPPPRPSTPPPAERMSLDTLFHDQLIKANIPKHQRISDNELNTLLNSTSGPENYGPRYVPDRSTPAAIVAELDRQLAKQKKEEEQQKRRYESIAAAHVPDIGGNSQDQGTVGDYSMATFFTRATSNQKDSEPLVSKPSNGISPPKLDLSRVHSPPPKSTLKVNHGDDPYSIDVHALKLPDIMSPPSDAYYQQLKQPILCIYSPPPVEGSPSSPPHYASSPEAVAGRTISPTSFVGGRGSPIQLHGKISSSSADHAASSPAIMYISSPGLMPTSSSHSLGQQGAHGKSAATLPIVSHNRSFYDGNHSNHQYQTQAAYQKSLHPQTQEFVSNMLSTNDPHFHTDPRNYRSATDTTSLADNIDESIYDYEAEYEDSLVEPKGDKGVVDLDEMQNRALLPVNATQNGADALLSLGYQYQHSTNSFVHKDERNRAKFGQYQRSSLSDPYAADFSDRHLEAIKNTTVGSSDPVIYIPAGTPAAEPALHKQSAGTVLPLTAASSVSTASEFTHDPAHVNRKGKSALSPREVLRAPGYAPVRTTMQYPHGVPLNAIHYRGEGIYQSDDSEDDDNNNNNNNNNHKSNDRNGQSNARSKFQNAVRANRLNSIDNSTLNSNNPGAEIKRDICDYIEKLASQNRAARIRPMKNTYSSAASVEDDSDTYYNNNNNNNNNNHNTDGDSTVQTNDKKTERARVKLWDKLNNRYGGDPEGDFVRKKVIKEYVYDGIRADTRIMKDYLEEMEDGWAV